ncbi:putative RNA methyltransferase [Leifsonia sp. AG29]|uniref:putative RNA methyltransferase n=1 Tax=Leifsonia sp. AG29 TaxID=2598860 RepID=UPI00131E374F|nr:methyltransferase domain-containing protein [Leifsonia sp. AG29]
MAADLDRLAAWLRCPVCTADLRPVDRLTLGCGNGHRHDVNKRGYVALLGSGTSHVGDTADMLDARERVLEGGAYSPIAAAVSAACSGEHIVDAGAGTGYYLRAALPGRPGAHGLAMDLSAQAVARAVRSSDRIDGLVADTWRPLPIRSGVADVVLDVFAPRNLPEFQRVLRPDGRLVVVVPRADHLGSLRETGTMLDIPSDKADDVIHASETLYALLRREHVAYDLPLTDDLRTALIAMGPSARHASRHTAEPVTVGSTRVSVDVLLFSRR